MRSAVANWEAKNEDSRKELENGNVFVQTIMVDGGRQLEGRVSYRRAIKMAIASTMRMGAEGIKIQIAGRVGGAEMARSEMFKEGRTPLHTIRADIDYALAEAHTKVGVLGIKVWICNGEVYGKRDLSPNAVAVARSNSLRHKNLKGRPLRVGLS